MAFIKLTIQVTNIEAVLAQFDKIKVYRSTVGEAGPYSEITTSSTRVSLVTGTTVYSFTDTAGDEAYFYRTSYFNSTTLVESSLSDPQQGEGGASLDIMSVEELKELYLFGLDLTDDNGNPMPDSLFEHYIRSAVSRLEHRLDIPITPKTFDEEHDFFKDDYNKYIWIELDKFPIISVSSIKLVLPGEVQVQDFPTEWFHILKEAGQVQLVPGTGTAGTILLGATGAWLPFIYGNNRFIPRTFRVNYTAGFESGKVPQLIKDVIGKMAAFGPLNIAGDLLGGAGIASQSIGIDGLSQSFSTTSSATNAGYGARILQYERELKEDYKALERFYKGLRLRVV